VDVLRNVGARWGGVVEAQRSVVCIAGRLEDAEGVPGEGELMPDEGDPGARALPPFPFASPGWGGYRTAPDRYSYPPENFDLFINALSSLLYVATLAYPSHRGVHIPEMNYSWEPV